MWLNLPVAVHSGRAGCLPGSRPVSAHLAEGAPMEAAESTLVFDFLVANPAEMFLSSLSSA